MEIDRTPMTFKKKSPIFKQASAGTGNGSIVSERQKLTIEVDSDDDFSPSKFSYADQKSDFTSMSEESIHEDESQHRW
jgi:hypothetical protein